jgi:hypothetical protein
MDIKLEYRNGKVAVAGVDESGKSVLLFTDPKFSITGKIEEFHYENGELVINKLIVESLEVSQKVK